MDSPRLQPQPHGEANVERAGVYPVPRGVTSWLSATARDSRTISAFPAVGRPHRGVGGGHREACCVPRGRRWATSAFRPRGAQVATEAGLRLQPIVEVMPRHTPALLIQVLGVVPDVILPEHRRRIRLRSRSGLHGRRGLMDFRSRPESATDCRKYSAAIAGRRARIVRPRSDPDAALAAPEPSP